MTTATSGATLRLLLGLLHPNANPDGVSVYGSGAQRLEDGVDSVDARRIAVVFASPLRRRTLARRAKRDGLDTLTVLLRGRPRPQQVVSPHAVALSTAFGREPPTTWRSRVLRKVPPRLLARLVAASSRAALVIHAPEGAPVAWLYGPGSSAVVEHHPFVLLVGADDARLQAIRFGSDGPDAIAKIAVTPGAAERLQREAAGLRGVAPAAAASGLGVPELVDDRIVGAMSVVVETVVAGEPAARLIARQPRAMEGLVRRLTEALTPWAEATSVAGGPEASAASASVFAAVQTLVPVLPPPAHEWIRGRLSTALDRPTTTTAAHNDLTMWNVVVPGHGRIGVLDWEAATHVALPLTDLFYVLADAAAAVERYRDRRAAFHACFRRDGRRAVWARGVVLEQARALGTGDDIVGASFLGCWSHHAANDMRQGGACGFVDMLRDVATTPELFWPLGDDAG